MKIKINSNLYAGCEGETIMELAKRNNIDIPNLCHKKGIEGQGRCRLCMVEVKEENKVKTVSSCVYPIREGIEVFTDTENLRNLRKNIILLMLIKAPNNEYINKLALDYEIIIPQKYIDISNTENCILCGLCVKACEKMGTNAISLVNRGASKKVATPYDDASKDCIGCGACAEVCPTKAIGLKDEDCIRTIWNTEFELIKCSDCGRYYATKDAIEFIENKIDDYKTLCDCCRKKIISNKFKETCRNTL